jgi:hypothetical protein
MNKCCKKLSYKEFHLRYIKRSEFYRSCFVYDGCEDGDIIIPIYLQIAASIFATLCSGFIIEKLYYLHPIDDQSPLFWALYVLYLLITICIILKPIMYVVYRISYWKYSILSRKKNN